MDPYDRIPYLSLPIADTHPDHLAVLGRLFGLPVAAPENCRVLELGCAGGGNLLPMAVQLPGSRFLGVDLSANQVAQGRRLIGALGLSNIELRQGDILQLDASTLGTFDYIIAHGVYSWVPAPVRERLLALARTLLAPAGVFYLSYNSLPGWRLRGMLRDILQQDCAGVSEPWARIAKAQQALARLEAATRGMDGLAARFLREEAARLRGMPDSYLLFEYLAENNQAFLFSDFLADTARHGLRYLCDSELALQFPATQGSAVEQALADLTDDMAVEQWLDFVSCRAFRQSLLVRDDAAGEGEIDLERFAALAFSTDLRLPAKLDLRREQGASCVRPDGERVELHHPLTKAICRQLTAAYPERLSLAELLPEARRQVRATGGGGLAEQVEALLLELFSLFAHRTLRAGLTPLRLPPAAEPPMAAPLPRALAAAGATQVPTRHHGIMELDALAARLLQLLDGSLTLEQAADRLADEIQQGRLVPPAGLAGRLPAGERRRERMQALCRELLGQFRRQGILV